MESRNEKHKHHRMVLNVHSADSHAVGFKTTFNGYILACDHFVSLEYKLGDINEKEHESLGQ
jgi:radical SAM protein with 4Fe4S-binding SPASM domain